FFFYCYAHHPLLHSFPTRRSSDLTDASSECLPNPDLPEATLPLGAAVSLLLPEDHLDACLRRRAGRRVDDGQRLQSAGPGALRADRKSTRLNSSHRTISYAVFCLK